MRTQYVKSIEKCASERGRRVRIYGVGNGLFEPQDPNADRIPRKAEESGLDWSTVLLAVLLLAEAWIIYNGISRDPGMRSGLFYDLKYLRLMSWGFLSVIGATVILFHYSIVVKTYEGLFRPISALACAGVFFVAFHILFLLFGGYAHLQVNAVDLHCSKKYNEQECLHARAKLEGLPRRHRRLLTKTSSIYGRMNGKATAADMAIMSLIQNVPSNAPAAAPEPEATGAPTAN